MKIALYAILLFGSLFIQMLGIMRLFPLYFTSPILFFVFFIILYSLNQRKRFTGYKGDR